jgi:hypothetical protein
VVRSRHDEGVRQRVLGDDLVDPSLEPADHVVGDQRDAGFEPGAFAGIRRQVRADHEQRSLESEELVRDASVRTRSPRDADRGHGLVHRSEGLGRPAGLRDATAVQQPGGSVVAGLRVDARHAARIAGSPVRTPTGNASNGGHASNACNMWLLWRL